MIQRRCSAVRPLVPQRRLVRALVLTGAALLTSGGAAVAQNESKPAPAADPQVELQSFQVVDGFEVNLFAADPLVTKAAEIAFDADGRLWVASRGHYPNASKRPPPDDKILVIEDQDGDGRADKSTVFAAGLETPSGLEPGDGGVYVATGDEIVLLKDTDGDGKADVRRVMLSGFSAGLNLPFLNTFRWGPDGMLYFNQPGLVDSHVETPYGVRRLADDGIWKFRPDAMQLEVFAHPISHSYGLAWDRWGQSFMNGGWLAPGMFFPLPCKNDPAPAEKVSLPQGDVRHSYFDRLDIVSGRHLPDEWQDSLITCDIGRRRVCRLAVSDDGAGFSRRNIEDVIASTDETFNPIDAKQGPDGAIYIVDTHGPRFVVTDDAERHAADQDTRSRIWRVTAKGRPPVERSKLTEASTAALLEVLKSSEGWTRHFARRVLAERGSDVVPQLDTWVVDLPQAHLDYEHFLLEALWTYQSLGVVEAKLLERVLHAQDGRVRAAGVRVLGQWHSRLSNPLELLTELIADDHPRVRLEAIAALAAVGTPEALQLAQRAKDKPLDPFLEQALKLTEREPTPGSK